MEGEKDQRSSGARHRRQGPKAKDFYNLSQVLVLFTIGHNATSIDLILILL